MTQVVFSRHARRQMAERGALESEVVTAIASGERLAAKRGRVAYRRNFPYGRTWGGKFYEVKQVVPIVAHEQNRIAVITVYTFYF